MCNTAISLFNELIYFNNSLYLINLFMVILLRVKEVECYSQSAILNRKLGRKFPIVKWRAAETVENPLLRNFSYVS